VADPSAVRFAPVRPGDRIAVVAPSGIVDADSLARGIGWFGARYRIDDDPRRTAALGYLAGPDADRAAALVEAVEDPSVRAVIATRGGYGAMRVLEHVGERVAEALRRDPKPVIGFSDVTALHALWSRERVISFHAPMVAAIGRAGVREVDRDALVHLLEGGRAEAWTGLEAVIAGEARGRATGGNVALMAALAGTPYAMSCEGAIVFVEDIGERPYRVDRMLTQLRLAGAFRGVRGFVIGDFTDCEPAPDGRRVAEVLIDRLGDLGVPLYANAPFGHAARQAPWAYGAQVQLRDGNVVFEHAH
jgi:muramoyltetrapeptide carboxypeptidase